MATTREQLKAEYAARRADLEEQTRRLQAELNEISAPVLEFRRIEQRMSELEQMLYQLRVGLADAKRRFDDDLKKALPDGLAQQMRTARWELSHRERPLEVSDPLRLQWLADLRRWYDEAEAAAGNPAVTTADLLELGRRGEALTAGIHQEQKEAPYVIS